MLVRLLDWWGQVCSPKSRTAMESDAREPRGEGLKRMTVLISALVAVEADEAGFSSRSARPPSVEAVVCVTHYNDESGPAVPLIVMGSSWILAGSTAPKCWTSDCVRRRGDSD